MKWKFQSIFIRSTGGWVYERLKYERQQTSGSSTRCRNRNCSSGPTGSGWKLERTRNCEWINSWDAASAWTWIARIANAFQFHTRCPTSPATLFAWASLSMPSETTFQTRVRWASSIERPKTTSFRKYSIRFKQYFVYDAQRWDEACRAREPRIDIDSVDEPGGAAANMTTAPLHRRITIKRFYIFKRIFYDFLMKFYDIWAFCSGLCRISFT